MKNTRRSFVKQTAIGLAGLTIGGQNLSAKAFRNIIGANDRINVAIVGLGRRMPGFIEPIARKSSNVKLLYLCDVMKSQRERSSERFSQRLDYKPALENDVRRIYDDKNVDAIIDLTPDHWHTPGTFFAVKSDKHVYVEKPCSHNPREGELLVELQKKYNKVIQMGNQQVSSPETIEIINEIHNGAIGNPYMATAFYNNNRGEVPVPERRATPEGLDWDLWQGPAPRQEYRHDTWNYNWHWYGWTWGTGETGNNAVHELHIARWALQADFPHRVEVNAGKFHFPTDGWSMYDTMDARYFFPGNKIIRWDGKSRNNYDTYGFSRGTLIYGTEGSVLVTLGRGGGYRLFDRSGVLVNERWAGDQSGVTARDEQGDMSTRHVVNFFDAIRGKASLRSPIDEGAKSTHLCHLANIAYRIGKGFEVNPLNGKALDENALKLWSREYEPGYEPIL